MSKEYSLPFGAINIAAGTTNPFLQIATPTTCGLELIGLVLVNDASETSAQELITCTRRTGATTLTNALTAVSRHAGDSTTKLSASTTTCAYTASGAGGAGPTILEYLGFNHLAGLYWFPPADARITMAPSGFITFEAVATFQAGTFSGFAVIRELS